MRVVVVVFAALLTLGLAAFGVVAAQRANAPAATTAMAAQVAPPAQSARPTPVRAPVADIAQNQIAEVAKPTVATDAPAVAPVILAQNTLVFREEPIDAVPDLSFVERIGTFGRNFLQSSRQVWLLENLSRLRDTAARQEYRCGGRKL